MCNVRTSVVSTGESCHAKPVPLVASPLHNATIPGIAWGIDGAADGAARRAKAGRGNGKMILIQRSTASDQKPRKAELSELGEEPIFRSVSSSKAAELVEEHPTERIRVKLEVFDWMLGAKDKWVTKSPAGSLVTSIEDDAPKGFETKAERATAGGGRAAAAGGRGQAAAGFLFRIDDSSQQSLPPPPLKWRDRVAWPRLHGPVVVSQGLTNRPTKMWACHPASSHRHIHRPDSESSKVLD